MPRYIHNLVSNSIKSTSILSGLTSVNSFDDLSGVSNPQVGMKISVSGEDFKIYEYIGTDSSDEPVWVDDNSEYISYDSSEKR